MSKSMLLFLTGLLLCPLVADGADWKLIAQQKDKEYSVLVDADSIESISAAVRKAWVRYEFKKTFSGEEIYDCRKCGLKKTLTHTIAEGKFDCDEKKYRLLEVTEYYTDAPPHTEEMGEDWKYAADAATDGMLVDYICK